LAIPAKNLNMQNDLQSAEPNLANKGVGQRVATSGAEDSHSTAAVVVLFVSFGSPAHYALWNSLSVETLAGDLIGEFGDKVKVGLAHVHDSDTAEAVLLHLRSNPTDILGVSVELGALPLLQRFAEEFAQASVAHRPLLVLGGQLATYCPETFLDDPRFSAAIICIHEGELAMRGLVEHVRKGRDLTDIPNLVYRDNTNRAIVASDLRAIDLVMLPHPPSTETAKAGMINMVQASRGCNFSCTFCTRHEMWDPVQKLNVVTDHPRCKPFCGWRPFALPRVLENVERLVARGIDEIEFCDDEFFGGRSKKYLDRVNAIADGIRRIGKKYDTELCFRVFTAPLIVARFPHNERIRKANAMVLSAIENLISAGLVRVYLGLDSANASQKTRYGRSESVDEGRLAIDLLRNLGLDIDVGFIMFDPELTLEEMLDNLNYFENAGLVEYNTWPFRPLVVNEGTAIKQRLEERGLLTGVRDPNFVAYEYRFKDPRVGRVAQLVEKMAEASAPIFYAIKTISRTHWRKKDTPKTRFARRIAQDNAKIYLKLMRDLVECAGSAVDVPREQRCCDEAMSAIFSLVEKVTTALGGHIFRGRMQDREALGSQIGAFERLHLEEYQLARARVISEPAGPRCAAPGATDNLF
jgi:radical SAM superfamily enzyme YgiQ (UPF0313 family)